MNEPKAESKFEFEKSLKELEELTNWFESGAVDLDAGLVKFERGMELASQLKKHLSQVENRIEKIKARFTDATETSSPAKPDTVDTDQAGLF